MLPKLFHRLTTQFIRKTSLSNVLVVTFVVQMLGAVSLVGWLGWRNGQVEVQKAADQVMGELSERTQHHLQTYTALPQKIVQLVATDLESGRIHLNTENLVSLDTYFLQQSQIFDTVSFIYLGDAQGRFIGAGPVRRNGQRTHIVEVADRTTGGNYLSFAINPQGQRTRATVTATDYDPRRRPWYQAAVSKGQATWSAIYAFIGQANTGLTITAVKPFYTSPRPTAPVSSFLSAAGATMAQGTPPQSKMAGVVAVDLYLNDMNEFLRQLQADRPGLLFIVDQAGQLVAHSKGQPTYIRRNDTAQPVLATHSQDALTRDAMAEVLRQTGSLSTLKRDPHWQFTLAGERQFVRVTPWQDGFGLAWWIVAVVPESAFVGRMGPTAWQMMWLGVAATLGTGLISMSVARWLVSPIMALNAATKRIAQDPWDAALTPLPRAPQHPAEVGELAESFHQMAQRLQQSFAELRSLNTALSTSEQRLHELLEALPIGVAVLERDGRYSYFNQTGQTLLGVNQPLPEVSLEAASAVYGVYRAGTDELYPSAELPSALALRGDVEIIDDMEIRRRDGQVISLEVRTRRVVNALGKMLYVIHTFQDISDRKRSEAQQQQTATALRQSEARFRRLTENNPGVIYRYVMRSDGSDAFLYISPRCRDLYGVEPEGVLESSMTLWSRVHQDDAIAMRESAPHAIQQALQTQQPWTMEYRVVMPDGSLRWLQASAAPDLQPDGEVFWDGFVVDISSRKQAEQLLADYNRILEQQVQERTLALEQEIAERKAAEMAVQRANQELQKLATFDSLTQLANRRRFDEYLAQEWQRALRERHSLALVLCDVDYFKAFNDSYGHQGGDTCLYQVAQAICRATQRSVDLVARYGGEEFAMILPNTDLAGAQQVAEAARQAVRQLQLPHQNSPIHAYVTISLGVASCRPYRSQRSAQLIAAADRALYQAKHQGRDRLWPQPSGENPEFKIQNSERFSDSYPLPPTS
jgi:diguanylate cyclase (GGDEF)-like protein/PAS domain S-box-containing protein